MLVSPGWLDPRNLLVLASLLVAIAAQGIDLNIHDDQSIKDAASTATYGMMKWYDGNATGGNPGAFPDKWWVGSAMFMANLQYWYFTGDDTYNDLTSKAMQHQAGAGDYMPKNYSQYLGNDDQMFWGLAAMLAAEIKFPEVSGGYSWLSLAQGVFNKQAARWDTSTCGGGLRWQIWQVMGGYSMKNTISNGGFFQLAARLLHYTQNETYGEWAEKAWDWSTSVKLVDNETWTVVDSTDADSDCATSSIGNTQWSYNYGTFLSGAAFMYNYTSKPKWKSGVDGLLNATITNFFPAQNDSGKCMSEVTCENDYTCNYNEALFKGLTSSWMAWTATLVNDTYDTILPKLQGSAEAAAGSCSGNGNHTCGIRWYGDWDEYTQMEPQISVSDLFSVNMIKNRSVGVVTAKTGGISKSNPYAGAVSDKNNDGPKAPEMKITTGDKAGAIVVTAVLGASWLALVAWLVIGV